LVCDRVRAGFALALSCERGTICLEFYPAISELFIWSFQGRGTLAVWRDVARIACRYDYEWVGCFTYHKAAIRFFRKFGGEVFETQQPGELRVRVKAENLWHP
jgi:hypothetical protein